MSKSKIEKLRAPLTGRWAGRRWAHLHVAAPALHRGNCGWIEIGVGGPGTGWDGAAEG